MLHICCAVAGAALAAIALAGFALGVTSWTTWIIALAAVLALGLSAIDRDVVARGTRGRSLVLGALALDAALTIAWHQHVARWLVLAAVVVATAAALVGVAAVVSARRRG